MPNIFGELQAAGRSWFDFTDGPHQEFMLPYLGSQSFDHFGNATTNVPHEMLRERPLVTVRLRNKTIGKLKRTYWDVAPGKPLALIGSSGLLEIAVRDGSAAHDLKLRVGDEIQLK